GDRCAACPRATPRSTEAAVASRGYSTATRHADERNRRLHELVRSDTNEQRQRQLHRLPQSRRSIASPSSTAARSALSLRRRVGGSVRKLGETVLPTTATNGSAAAFVVCKERRQLLGQICRLSFHCAFEPRDFLLMQKIGFADALDSIVANDPRYQRQGYIFLRDALDFTTK